MPIFELILTLENELINHLPTPDHSVCYVLFWYMATSVIPVIHVM